MSAAKLVLNVLQSELPSYGDPKIMDMHTVSVDPITEFARHELTVGVSPSTLVVDAFTASSPTTVIMVNRSTSNTIRVTHRDIGGGAGVVDEIPPEKYAVIPGVDPTNDLILQLSPGETGEANLSVTIFQ